MHQTKLFDIEQLAYLSDESFIHHCFVRAFRRSCNPSLAMRYLAALSSGISRGEVVRSIFKECEYTLQTDTAALRNLLLLDGEQFLRTAYRIILGRPIDNNGLEHYSQCLTKGERKERILYDLATSAEGQARQFSHKGLCEFIDFLDVPQRPINLMDIKRLFDLENDEFIYRAYRLFLRREADAAGFANYLRASRVGISKIKILHSLAYSAEGRKFQKTVLAWLYLTFGQFL